MKKTQALTIAIETANTPAIPSLARIGLAARHVARQHALKSYHDTLAANTLKRHAGDLSIFAQYLSDAGEKVTAEALMYDLATWAGATEGLLEGFKQWMLEQGHAIGSVNIRLATVKRYCDVAGKAGFINGGDLGLIKSVHGYRGREGRNVDTKRTVTRVEDIHGKPSKKGVPVAISIEQAEALLHQADSRDALLMYLFLRLGLRVGEVSSLEVDTIDLSTGHIVIYRQKVDLTQTHELRWNGIEIARRYLDDYQPHGKLFTGEAKKSEDGSTSTEYTIRAIQKRVKRLGDKAGVAGLSPHDCRHYWATRMAREKTHIKAMQDAGGWRSPYMALRYAESSAIANEGVIL